MKRWAMAAAVIAGLGGGARAQTQAPVYLVFFPLWSGDLDSAANQVIADAAARLKQGGQATVTGFADNAGSQQANLFLTQLRAQRVIDGLVAAGVAPDHLKLVAAGAQQQPGIASRRAEIDILP